MQENVDSDNWVKAPPKIGEVVQSEFVIVPDLVAPNPWHDERAELERLKRSHSKLLDSYGEPVSTGWLFDKDGRAVIDEEFFAYRKKFGWVNDEPSNACMEDMQYGFARSLADYARQHAFASFHDGVLGVTVESTMSAWPDETSFRPDHYDIEPHLDWVNREPVLLSLAAVAQPTYAGEMPSAEYQSLMTSVYYEGGYVYRGDLQDRQGKTIAYEAEVARKSVSQVNVEAGQVVVGDARRSLHNKRLLEGQLQDYPDNMRRVFTRAFVALRPDVPNV